MSEENSVWKLKVTLCWLCWFILIWLAEPTKLFSVGLVTDFSYAMIITSILIVVTRAGVSSVAFWVVCVAAGPLLAPLVTVDILGFDIFNTRAIWLQSPDKYAKPLLYGATVVWYLSLALDGPIEGTTSSKGSTNARHRSMLPWTIYLVLFVTGGLALGAAILADPHLQFIGRASYNEIHAQQSQTFAFAGAGYLVLSFAALALHFDINDLESNKNVRRVASFIFWLFLGASTLWLLSKGNRSEAAGVLLVLFIIYSARLATWLRILIGFGGFLIVAAIGYLRLLIDPFEYIARSTIALPGGVDYVMIGYVAGFDLFSRGILNLPFGSTYVSHLERLPPNFLGLERPDVTYDILYDAVLVKGSYLQGGEYFLLEPLLNAGLGALAVTAIGVAVFFSWCTREISRYTIFRSRGLAFVVATSGVAGMFRYLWYGLTPGFKIIVISFIVGFVLQSIRNWAILPLLKGRGSGEEFDQL